MSFWELMGFAIVRLNTRTKWTKIFVQITTGRTTRYRWKWLTNLSAGTPSDVKYYVVRRRRLLVAIDGHVYTG